MKRKNTTLPFKEREEQKKISVITLQTQEKREIDVTGYKIPVFVSEHYIAEKETDLIHQSYYLSIRQAPNSHNPKGSSMLLRIDPRKLGRFNLSKPIPTWQLDELEVVSPHNRLDYSGSQIGL